MIPGTTWLCRAGFAGFKIWFIVLGASVGEFRGLAFCGSSYSEASQTSESMESSLP